MDEDKPEKKETSNEFPSFPPEDMIDEINNVFNSNKPLTIGGFLVDGKFYEIKPSWWRNLLAKARLKLSGWKWGCKSSRSLRNHN